MATPGALGAAARWQCDATSEVPVVGESAVYASGVLALLGPGRRGSNLPLPSGVRLAPLPFARQRSPSIGYIPRSAIGEAEPAAVRSAGRTRRVSPARVVRA